MRFGAWRAATGRGDEERYTPAGLTMVGTLLSDRYLSGDPSHPRPAATSSRGEATMWGDYHQREVALCVQRLAENGPYPRFFGPSRIRG